MTSISTIDDLVMDVLLLAPGATDNQALRELRLAAARLIEKSECWTEDIELETVAGQSSYTLTPTASDALVHSIDSLLFDNSSTPADERTYYLNPSTRKLTFEANCVPSTAGQTMTATVVLIPEHQAETLPAWVLQRHAEGIAARAAARIMAPSAQVYREPSAFIAAVGAARMNKERRGTRRRMETRP
jgi:hypothetical protein